MSGYPGSDMKKWTKAEIIAEYICLENTAQSKNDMLKVVTEKYTKASAQLEEKNEEIKQFKHDDAHQRGCIIALARIIKEQTAITNFFIPKETE